MMGRKGCRILSNAPIKDAVEIRVERAKEKAGKKMRALGEMGREKMKALGNEGKERLCAGAEKFLAAEEKIERVFSEVWRSHKDKATALIAIFILGNMGWNRTKDGGEQGKLIGPLDEPGDGLKRKGKRAHGSISQDASGWYNQCGLPRYPPVVSGRGQSHLYVAQNRRVNDSAE